MAFQSARWRWEFLGTPWSNASDANPPDGDTKPPVVYLADGIIVIKKKK